MASTIELLLLAAKTARPPVAAWTSVTTHSNANSTTPLQLTDAWTISAYDAQPLTIYEVECPFSGVWESQTLTFELSVDGSATGIANVTVGAVFLGSGTTFAGTIRAKLQFTAVGSSGNFTAFIDGTMGDTAANRVSGSSGNTVTLNGQSLTNALNTTTSHTVQINAAWGASASGQTVTGQGSAYTRKGP